MIASKKSGWRVSSGASVADAFTETSTPPRRQFLDDALKNRIQDLSGASRLFMSYERYSLEGHLPGFCEDVEKSSPTDEEIAVFLRMLARKNEWAPVVWEVLEKNFSGKFDIPWLGDGVSPLNEAILSESALAAEKLSECGASAFAVDASGSSPIMSALAQISVQRTSSMKIEWEVRFSDTAFNVLALSSHFVVGPEIDLPHLLAPAFKHAFLEMKKMMARNEMVVIPWETASVFYSLAEKGLESMDVETVRDVNECFSKWCAEHRCAPRTFFPSFPENRKPLHFPEAFVFLLDASERRSLFLSSSDKDVVVRKSGNSL